MRDNSEVKVRYTGKSCKVNGGADVVTIVEYIRYTEVYVVFEGYSNKVKTNMDAILKRMSIKNPELPTICGVGITGGLTTKVNGKHLDYYRVWTSMLKRCYTDNVKDIRPNYKDTVVCDNWKYLPNFKKWFDDNYKDGWYLDKDLKVFDSNIYSPDTCAFLPNHINVLLNSNKRIRSSSGFCGVYHDKSVNRYYPKVSVGKETWWGKGYRTPEEAFNIYAEKKKEWILNVVSLYPDIDEIVKNNLINCQITPDGFIY